MKIADYYDCLIEAENDPFRDGRVLREYMDKWDGSVFLEAVGVALDGRLREKDVLEIGVGTGRIAARVLSECKTFTGIDLSPKTIARTEENLADFSNKLLICGDFFDYSFTERFDVIYSTLTFWHIEEKQRAADKVFSLLSAGGRFVLSISKDMMETARFGENVSTRLYPDTAEKTFEYLKNASFADIQKLETEFAYIFVAIKNDEVARENNGASKAEL